MGPRGNPVSSPKSPRLKSRKPRFDPRNPSTIQNDSDNESLDSDADPELQQTSLELDADPTSKRGQGAKRNAVNLAGFDSDSSTGEHEDGAAEKECISNQAKNGDAKAQKSVIGEQTDIFADMKEPDGDEDEDKVAEGKKRKKEVRFLELTEIEGEELRSKERKHIDVDLRAWVGKHHGYEMPAEAQQERDRRRREQRRRRNVEDGFEDGEDSDDSFSGSSSASAPASFTEEIDRQDLDAEVGAGGLKSHAPQIEQFNTRNDRKEGAFDETGNFVRKAADVDAKYDSWLDGLKTKDIRKAREAQAKRDQETAIRTRREDEVLTVDALSTLIRLLEPGENTLESLARLGKCNEGATKKKLTWQERRKMKKSGMEVESNGVDQGDQLREGRRKNVVEELTTAAGILERRGQAQIYEMERELLMRQFQREAGEPWSTGKRRSKNDDIADLEDSDKDFDQEVGKGGNVQTWEYRWTDGRDGGAVHGPYGTESMKSWSQAGYLGSECEFRQFGSRGPWMDSADFG